MHLPRRMTFDFAMALFLALPAVVWAETDEGQDLGKYLGQHGYGLVRANVDNNQQFFEAKINGRSVFFQIDTGCARTCITQECSRSLRLNVHDSKAENWGLGGKINGVIGQAIVNSFTINNYEINRTNLLQVLPPGTSLGEHDGLFGIDFLRYNAVILPVGARKFLFKPGNAAPPPIESFMGAMGFKSLPIHYTKNALYIEGQLNGHPFSAILDCGAEYSTFDLDYIKKVGGGQVVADQIDMQGVDGARETAYGFLPRHLNLGGLMLDNTELTASKAPVFSHEGFNALFGYDWLAAHNAILDLGHDALWIK